MRITGILSLLCFLSINSCSEGTSVKDSSRSDNLYELPQWAKSANIYEVNIRQFTEEGTINAFSEHLPRLKEMGVEILWFMPIYPISTTKQKGTLGSYYSVSDFRKINPEFGTMEDMDMLIGKIHQLGMKVILDWVPNHTGWDHHWITEHPDWYTRDEQGQIVDPQNEQGESYGWTDVADLNYDSEEMRSEMIEQLKWWVTEKDIDGYRMDIAFGVPADFWKTVREALYPIKPLFMLAESEDAIHRNDSTFQATYGWNLFHCMNDIVKEHKTVQDFRRIHSENNSKFNQGNTLNFTSNHDENAWNGSAIERLGESAKGWAALMTLIDGVPLIYSGMEEPMIKRLEFFEKDTIGFDKFEYAPFYKKLFQLKKNNKALWNAPFGGDLKWILTDKELLAFTRSKEDNHVSFIFNPTKSAIQFTSELTDQTSLNPNQYLIIEH